MMYNNSVNKKKLNYLIHKYEMNETFKWIKERTAKTPGTLSLNERSRLLEYLYFWRQNDLEL